MESDTHMKRQEFHINFARFITPTAIISSLLVLASFVFMATKGINYGVDFLGGVKLQYQFKTATNEDAIKDVVSPLIKHEVQVIRFGKEDENRFMLQIPLKDGDDPRGYSASITQALRQSFGNEAITLEQEETVGPKAGKDLRNRGISAVLISIILVVIYMAYRFDLFFAPGAVVALLHDVAIPMGVFALLGKEFNLPIVAALLTIVGYSLNDTIIIFDRIRENEKQMDRKNFREIVYKSLNSTLSRTIVTSLTVFIVVLVLFLYGGGVIHDFSLAFLIGVVAGTYSSIFVASPVYIALKEWKGFKGEK